MAFDKPSLTSSPVAILAILAVLGLFGASDRAWPTITVASVLSVTYMVVVVALSPLENHLIGHHYKDHADVYRAFSGFAPTYMLLHPVLLGCLVAAGWDLLGLQAGAAGGYLGMRYSACIAFAGAAPVYTLGFASLRAPPGVVVAWQAHTAMQLMIGGYVLDRLLTTY